jgi:hypothetical protein
MIDRPCKTYCCSYFHDGSWWAINITAYDWADAEDRAKKLSLQLCGEHYMTIPANTPASGILTRLIVLFKNVAARLHC